MRLNGWALAGLALLSACTKTEMPRAAVIAGDTTRPWRKAGDKVDSLLPMPEYIRRFQEGLVEPTELQDGAADRDALARLYLDAIGRRDTAALGKLLVTRAEFGWLVFPDHLYSRPPYELDPAVVWLQLAGENDKGLGRVLQRYGGRPLRLEALTCRRDTLQIVSGPDTVWTDCRLRYRAADSTLMRSLFGSIIQRRGRAKFLSYHSEF